jgi:hypothetical protein
LGAGGTGCPFSSLTVWAGFGFNGSVKVSAMPADEDNDGSSRGTQDLGNAHNFGAKTTILPRFTVDSVQSETDLSEFLAILTEVHCNYPDAFSQIGKVRGRIRRYFAQTASEIEDTGSSTMPRKIPGSNWWVCTNNSRRLKRLILQRAFIAVGCTSEDKATWLQQFDRRGEKPIPLAQEEFDEYGGPKI